MLTLKNPVRIEFEEKKSKFIGWAAPVQNREDAEKFIRKIKNDHRDATHNCSAYKVFENGQEYFKLDDDGEPSGTAGKPMGEIITLMGVDNCVVVATRYFGGIKLGAGGLVRNYAKTAKLAIQESEIVEFTEKEKCMIDFDYEKNSEVDLIIISSSGVILDKNYGERVTYSIEIPKSEVKKLKEIKGLIVL